MSKLVRLSLSIEESLFKKLEDLVSHEGYRNRSEYIRDMIRDQLVADQWDSGKEVIATMTIIYDHHKRELSEKLTDLQHHHHHIVLAATHIHLTENICAEMIMIRGESHHVKELTNLLRQQKGVLHSGITMSSTGMSLE